jgi:hypothetical protein
MKRRFQAARIPAYTLLAALAGASVLYYFQILENERYLVRRSFQTLAGMGEDILEKIESVDEAAENFCGPRQERCAAEGALAEYFARRVRDIEAFDPAPDLLTRVYPLKRPVTVGFRLDPFVGRVREKELLDSIVLADEKGKAIKSWRLLPGAVSIAPDLAERALRIEESQRGKPEGDVVFEGRAGGLPHRFLLHRFTIPAARWRPAVSAPACATPDGEEENCASRTPAPARLAKFGISPATPAGDRTVVLLGLISSERLRSESMQIPHSIALLLVFFVLLAITSMPLLQVQFMNARQRFSRMDLVGLVFGNVLAAALLTCGLLTTHFFYFEQRARTDRLLAALAAEIEDHLQAEVTAIRNQAEALSRQFQLVSAHGSRGGLRRASLLNCREPVAYPFFDTVIWMDGGGCQRAKWTTLKENTPFVSVREREYFRAARDGCHLWNFGDPARGFFVESMRSKNTAQLRSAVSIPVGSRRGCEGLAEGPPPGERDFVVATIVGRLMSVMEPTLPASFGFAIVDASGKILFHSVEGRSQRENFLEETDSDKRLRAAFLERRTEAVNADYYGRPHRVLVHQFTRLRGSPWTLLTFRDKSAGREAMVQVMTITGRMLLWFAIGLAVCVGLLFLLPRREPLECRWVNLMRRVWPDERRREVYVLTAAALVAYIAGMTAVFFLGTLWMKVMAAFVSLGALPAVVVAISWKPARGRLKSTGVPRSYWIMAYLTLIAAAVAPCATLYGAALEFEGEVQSRHSQLVLWKRLVERADRVARQFDARDMTLDAVLRAALVKRRLLTPLMSGPESGTRLLPDVYLAMSFRQSPWSPGEPLASGALTAFLRTKLAGYRGQYDRNSMESQQALAGRAPDGSWSWVAGAAGPELSSERSALRIASLPLPVAASLWTVLAWAGLAAVGAVWTRLCVYRVFYFDTDPSPWEQNIAASDEAEFEAIVRRFREKLTLAAPPAVSAGETAAGERDRTAAGAAGSARA